MKVLLTQTVLLLVLICHCQSFSPDRCLRTSSSASPSVSSTSTMKSSPTPINIIPPPPPISVPVYSLATPTILNTPKLTSSSSPNSNNNKNDGTTNDDNDDDDNNSMHNKIIQSYGTSMNIITFATPVSVAPPKLWTISLYYNTCTKDSFIQSKVAILQLLHKDQFSLIPILGKRSGYEEGYDKSKACHEVGYAWTSSSSCRSSMGESTFSWGGVDSDTVENNQNLDSDIDDINSENDSSITSSIEVLPKCQSYIQLKLLKTMEAGDHEVALCQVMGVGMWDDELNCVVPVDSETLAQPKDESTVLYTGYLREKGII